MLSGPRDVSTAYERVVGFHQAMQEAGLETRAENVVWGEYTQESGRKMTELVLDSNPRPTAIFAANNFIAIGALRAIYDADLKVPGDISVVSFDDLPEALIAEPFITNVAQPTYDMGFQATQLLIARMTGDESENYQSILLPTELIIRQSSGPPIH
jgi:LacI family transcriptional regulator